MKIKHFASLFALMLLSVEACAESENPRDEWNADYASLTSGNHPRLVISDSELTSIREQVSSGINEPLSIIHAAIIDAADNLLSAKPLVYKKDASGKRILTVSRNAAQRISYCAYAYRYTGEKKYLDKAVSSIREVCGFPDWNPSHFLDVCEMVSGVAIGYDWLYDNLPADVKTLIEEKVKAYAFDTMDQTDHETPWTIKNNRNQVQLGGLVCAALGLFEVYPEIGESVIRRAAQSSRSAVEYMYNPDGIYPEGPGYWNYGTCYQAWTNLLMKDNLGTNFGLDEIAGFRKTPWFAVFTTGSTEMAFNYSDGRPDPTPHYPIWYFADLLDNPGLLFSEINYLKNHDYITNQQRALVFIALKYASKIKPTAVLPPSTRLYYGDGIAPIASARSGWGPDDLWFGIKGGKSASPHGHMDVGAFVYDAYGVRWSKDVFIYTYDKVERPLAQLHGSYFDIKPESLRWRVSRVNCHWHSCLLIDDEDILVEGYSNLLGTIDQADRIGATFDLTPLYKNIGRVERTVSICNNEYLEVIDLVQTGTKARKVRFNLVSEAEPLIMSDGVLVVRNGISVKLQTNVQDVTYKIWDADPSWFNDFSFECLAPDTYICGFEARVPKNSTQIYITTLKKL